MYNNLVNQLICWPLIINFVSILVKIFLKIQDPSRIEILWFWAKHQAKMILRASVDWIYNTRARRSP